MPISQQPDILRLTLSQAEAKCHRSAGRKRCRYLIEDGPPPDPVLLCAASHPEVRAETDRLLARGVCSAFGGEGYACAQPRDDLSQSFPAPAIDEIPETPPVPYTPHQDAIKTVRGLMDALAQDDPDCGPAQLFALTAMTAVAMSRIDSRMLAGLLSAYRRERIWFTEGSSKGVRDRMPDLITFTMQWKTVTRIAVDLHILIHSGEVYRTAGPVPRGQVAAEVFLGTEEIDARLASLRGSAAASGKTIIRGITGQSGEEFRVERARRREG